MATKQYSLPSLQRYDSSSLNYRSYVSRSTYYDFHICKDINDNDPDHDLVLKKGYCGNSSTGFANVFASTFDFDWSSDSSLNTSSSNVYFPILQDSNNNYFVDWNDAFTPAQDWYFNDVGLDSTFSSIILFPGVKFDYTEGSGGSVVEPSVPCDNPYDGVISAIYTCAAVPFVIGLFIVIYHLFMRLRG